MAHKGAQRIRNIAIVGHRGSGKTSLNEALLFEAGVVNRLGSVTDGSTVSDSEPDEQEREMSISASLSSFEHEDRKINLIDTPGDPSFVADALGALQRLRERGLLRQRRDGRRGVDRRLWERADGARPGAARVREHARPRARRLLPRARLAQGRLRPARGRDRDPDRIRARDARHRRPDRHEGATSTPAPAAASATEIPIPDEIADQAQEYREKLMDEVAENSDDLMERYLEGEEISHDEIVVRAEGGRHRGHDLPGHVRRRDQEPRHRQAARRARAGPAVARQEGRGQGARRRGQRGRDRARRRRRADRLRVQDAGRPVRGTHQPVPRLLRAR